VGGFGETWQERLSGGVERVLATPGTPGNNSNCLTKSTEQYACFRVCEVTFIFFSL